MFKFEMLAIVTNNITGYTGTITARAEWLGTVNSYRVENFIPGEQRWIEKYRLQKA